MSLECFRLEFFQVPHVHTQIPGRPDPNPGTSRPKSRDILAMPSKTTEEGALHYVSIQDIPGSGSGIFQCLGLWFKGTS